MTTFHVSPSIWVPERAEFAARGVHDRPGAVLACRCAEGIALVAHQRGASMSRGLRVTSEIHDRVAFAAVGRFCEVEELRIAGIRFADLRAYTYDRRDVTGRSLATMYGGLIGQTFSQPDVKPWEVQLVVVELGQVPPEDRLHVINWDGEVNAGTDPVVLGMHGTTEVPELDPEAPLREIVSRASGLMEAEPDDLEVSLLDRRVETRRHFRRLDAAEALRS